MEVKIGVTVTQNKAIYNTITTHTGVSSTCTEDVERGHKDNTWKWIRNWLMWSHSHSDIAIQVQDSNALLSSDFCQKAYTLRKKKEMLSQSVPIFTSILYSTGLQ